MKRLKVLGAFVVYTTTDTKTIIFIEEFAKNGRFKDIFETKLLYEKSNKYI